MERRFGISRQNVPGCSTEKQSQRETRVDSRMSLFSGLPGSRPFGAVISGRTNVYREVANCKLMVVPLFDGRLMALDPMSAAGDDQPQVPGSAQRALGIPCARPDRPI